MSCTKAQGFLEENALEVKEQTDARKEKRGREEALTLAKSVNRIIVAKGKKVIEIDMKKEPPDDDTLASHLLGPTGNLRAPTIQKGKTLLVGFNPTAYENALNN